MRIGIIGDGNVGSALRRGLSRAGHDVEAVGKEPKRVREVAAGAEVVVLAVPYGAVDDAVRELGDAVDGKVLVDVTNALDENYDLAVGLTTSGAEELQKKMPRAKVVKAFNTSFASTMDRGEVGGEKLTVFAAGDDDGAKRKVLEMATSIGFDAVDAGPLRNARLLEPLALLHIRLGYNQKMGTDMGLRLVH
jgi:hypothetical protein